MDYVHTAEVVEAVITALRAGLPTNFFAAGADGDEVPLRTLQHGDLADYTSIPEVLDLTPAIIVRGLGTVLEAREIGKYRSLEPVRIIHIRRYSDCRDSTGTLEENHTRSRERYAKLIGAAIFADEHNRLAIDSGETRTEAAITCGQIFDVRLASWDLGYDAGASSSMTDVARWRATTAGSQSWAIGCQIEVRLKTGRT